MKFFRGEVFSYKFNFFNECVTFRILHFFSCNSLSHFCLLGCFYISSYVLNLLKWGCSKYYFMFFKVYRMKCSCFHFRCCWFMFSLKLAREFFSLLIFFSNVDLLFHFEGCFLSYFFYLFWLCCSFFYFYKVKDQAIEFELFLVAG